MIADIVLFFKEKMSRRLTATQALGLLRDISSDCLDGEQSDDDMNDVENEVVQVVLSDEESSDLDNDDELDSGAAVSPNNVNTEDDEQIFLGKDGSSWQALAPNQAVSGRLQQQNMMRIRPGVTAYVAFRIISDRPLSLFRIFFNGPMLRNLQKCTIAEAQRVTGDPNWRISLDELEKFLGLIIARRVIGVEHIPSTLCGIDCGDLPFLTKLCLVTDFSRL